MLYFSVSYVSVIVVISMFLIIFNKLQLYNMYSFDHYKDDLTSYKYYIWFFLNSYVL